MNLFRRAFSTKGGDKDRGWLIDEFLDEDPRREAWLDLPFERVKALYQAATLLYEDEGVPFKTTFKKLLNKETALERRQAAAPPKPQKTQQEIDDENHRLWLEAQEEEKRIRKQRKRQSPSPGGGAGGRPIKAMSRSGPL